MTTIALTSELDAVNTLLAAISESAVNTLEVTGLADVASARKTLDEISREVQLVGWHFNTEDDYPLPRDTSNRITLPANTLKCVITSSSSTDITQRGLRLYDKTNHRDTFTEDLKGRVVTCLPWDELPQVARHFIMVRAARIFQARTLGSDTQFRFSEHEERDAKKSLDETEGETGNYNLFTGSYSVTAIMER